MKSFYSFLRHGRENSPKCFSCAFIFLKKRTPGHLEFSRSSESESLMLRQNISFLYYNDAKFIYASL